MNRPANIQLDAATLRRVDELAQTTSRARDSLIEEALERYLDYEEWFVAQVEEGVAAADHGALVDHDTVVADVRERLAKRRT